MGKGSARRPQLVSEDEALARWEAIFGKRKEDAEPAPKAPPVPAKGDETRAS